MRWAGCSEQVHVRAHEPQEALEAKREPTAAKDDLLSAVSPNLAPGSPKVMLNKKIIPLKHYPWTFDASTNSTCSAETASMAIPPPPIVSLSFPYKTQTLVHGEAVICGEQDVEAVPGANRVPASLLEEDEKESEQTT